jgi:hypothetical protein
MIYSSSGPLLYSWEKEYGYKLIVEVDQGLSDYYRSLIPKWIKTNKQMYDPHISVVRKEVPKNLEYWGKYEGEEIDFQYTGTIYFGTVYCWLNTFSKRLEEIRLELGLPVSSEYTRPPETYIKVFHYTLGNFK